MDSHCIYGCHIMAMDNEGPCITCNTSYHRYRVGMGEGKQLAVFQKKGKLAAYGGQP